MSIVVGQYDTCEVHILSEDDVYDMSPSEVLAEVDKELSISTGEEDKVLDVVRLHDLVLIIES